MQCRLLAWPRQDVCSHLAFFARYTGDNDVGYAKNGAAVAEARANAIGPFVALDM